MPEVHFLEPDLSVTVEEGTSLLAAAQAIHARVGYACGGVCACSTCHVYVESGAELLTPAEEAEEDILDKAFDVRMNSRLACQARLTGPGLVRVRPSRESRQAYENEHPEHRS